MTREQVIKGLECCGANGSCAGCPYINFLNNGCMDKLNADALALLKEQEPVQPKKSALHIDNGFMWNIWDCGYCGSQLRGSAKYCDQCGKAVKWE